jgi:hypothetical protein
MQTRCCIALCLVTFVTICLQTVETAAAQPASREPMVSLTVSNVPLGEALDTLSRDTGYRFHLSSQWKTHPVSVNISKVPLEKALKRLLRNLNHSIVWESEDSIRILVYGASEATGDAHAVSFAAPPQEEIPEEIEPFDPVEDPVEDPVDESVDESIEQGVEIDAAEAPEELVRDEEGAGTGEEEAKGF